MGLADDAEKVARKARHGAAVSFLIRWCEDHGLPGRRDTSYLATLVNEKHPGTCPGGGVWTPDSITGTLGGQGLRCPNR